jgi:hypothetical protein
MTSREENKVARIVWFNSVGGAYGLLVGFVVGMVVGFVLWNEASWLFPFCTLGGAMVGSAIGHWLNPRKPTPKVPLVVEDDTKHGDARKTAVDAALKPADEKLVRLMAREREARARQSLAGRGYSLHKEEARRVGDLDVPDGYMIKDDDSGIMYGSRYSYCLDDVEAWLAIGTGEP